MGLLPEPGNDKCAENEIVVLKIGCSETCAQYKQGILHADRQITRPCPRDDDTSQNGRHRLDDIGSFGGRAQSPCRNKNGYEAVPDTGTILEYDRPKDGQVADIFRPNFRSKNENAQDNERAGDHRCSTKGTPMPTRHQCYWN